MVLDNPPDPKVGSTYLSYSANMAKLHVGSQKIEHHSRQDMG